VKVGIRCPDVVASPVIWATQDGYQPRTIVFFVANAETDLTNVRQYVWNFGDGTTGSSRDDGISHDCTGDLLRDRLYANFDVQIDAHDARGLVATATRTIAVLNT
jgi:hypothetical protein